MAVALAAVAVAVAVAVAAAVAIETPMRTGSATYVHPLVARVHIVPGPLIFRLRLEAAVGAKGGWEAGGGDTREVCDPRKVRRGLRRQRAPSLRRVDTSAAAAAAAAAAPTAATGLPPRLKGLEGGAHGRGPGVVVRVPPCQSKIERRPGPPASTVWCCLKVGTTTTLRRSRALLLSCCGSPCAHPRRQTSRIRARTRARICRTLPEFCHSYVEAVDLFRSAARLRVGRR